MTLKCSCVPSDIMNNKIFYQHPNLMRVLGMHETVMEVMVNVLGGDKSQVGLTAPICTFCGETCSWTSRWNSSTLKTQTLKI